MAKFCSNCGYPISEDVTFCGVCGQPCNAGPVNAQPPAQPPVQPAQSQWPQPNVQPSPPQQTPPGSGAPPFAGASGGAYRQGMAQGPAANNAQYGQGQYYGYPQNNQTAAAIAPKSKKSILPLVIILAVVGAAVIGVILLVIFGGSDSSAAKRVMNNYVKYYVTDDYNAQKYLDLIYEYNFCTDPDYRQDLFDEAVDYIGSGDAYEELRDAYGADAEVELEVLYANELTGGDFQDVIEELSDTCSTGKINKMIKARVKETVTRSTRSKSFTEDVYVIKAGGKWYIANSLSGQ